jgi:hypothetical protein
MMLDKVAFYLQVFISRFLYFIYPNRILKLKDHREHLVKEILDFVDTHINEVDPKYEKERILFNKEKGESEKNILIQRNHARKLSRDIRFILDQTDIIS